MGSSLWQWSSGHKSKRAHKHHMTDGWEDSFGQGGRNGEREMKWDREEREKDRGGREISGWIVKSYEKSQVLDGLWMPCSMSAVKGTTRNHRGNSLPLMSNRNTTSEWSQGSVNTCQNSFFLLLQEIIYKINLCSFSWKHKREHYIDFGQLVGWKVYPPAWHKNGWKRYLLNIKAEHRRKLRLKSKDERLLRRHLQSFKPAAPTCQRVSSKGCLAQHRLWRVWQISTAYWKSWPEEDDVFQ